MEESMNLRTKIESTLTDRYQTTIPKSVRDILQLGKKDKIEYHIDPNGTVCISRAEADEPNDPMLDNFLVFLSQDMTQHPERIHSVSADLVHKAQSLVQDVEIDLDQPLSDDDE
jgi:antitoxin PrlF